VFSVVGGSVFFCTFMVITRHNAEPPLLFATAAAAVVVMQSRGVVEAADTSHNVRQHLQMSTLGDGWRGGGGGGGGGGRLLIYDSTLDRFPLHNLCFNHFICTLQR